MSSKMHHPAGPNVLSAIAFISVALLGADAWAGDKTWTGGTTNWNTAGNWNPSGVPGNNDRAIIPNLANKPIVGNNLSVGQIQVAAGSSITISGNNILTVTGLSNIPAANTSVSPVIDGTGSIITTAGSNGQINVTGGLTNGTLINSTMTLGNFQLSAPVGRNMSIPSGTTLTFNGFVNLSSSEMLVGAAAGAANSLVINGALTVAASSTLSLRSPSSTMSVSGNIVFSGVWIPGSSTVTRNPTANQTLTFANTSYTFNNLVVNTDTGANQIDGDLVTPNAAFVIQGNLAITRGQFQVGAFTLDVLGNITSGDPTQAQFDFFNAPGVLRVKGNVDLASVSQVNSGTGGPFATIILNGTTPQTFRIRATTASQYHDLDAFQVSNPAGVTVLDNPNADFVVNGALTIDAGCSLTVQDTFNPLGPVVMTAGVAPTTGGTLRIEGAIVNDTSPLGTSFSPGNGTVVYAGQGVSQTVYTASGTSSPIAYYNLTIDNTTGMTATQQGNNIVLDVNGDFVIQSNNATFTAGNGNMTVAKNFTDNGTFNNAGATVTMDGTGSINGTATTLTFNNLLISGLATDVVTAARDFTTANTFQVVQGSLATSGAATAITMTAQQGMLVGNGAGAAGTAALNLNGIDALLIAPTKTFSVNATDGRFTSLGLGPPYDNSQARNPTLSHSAAGSFTATVGGQVNLYGLNFSFADYQGLNIASTATVSRLRNVRFTSIFGTTSNAQPARHLSVAVANLDLDCPGCYFESNPGAGFSATAGPFNVWANGAGLRLRFEDRRSSGSTAYNGPGAGEAYDGDDDANNDGVVTAGETTALHNGALIQWVYTINVDMTGALQGFPEPAFDWNSFTYYSTYVVSKQAAGTSDTIYVLTADGDLKPYSFSPGVAAGNITAPLFWDSEGGTHVVYFGTITGLVYKLVDTGAGLVMAPAPWNTPLVDASLNYVSTPIMSDQTNLYFGGNDNLNPGASTAHWGLYRVVISTKTISPVAMNLQKQSVTAANSWADTAGGRMIFQATGLSANGTASIYRIRTSSWAVDAQVNTTTGNFNAATNVPLDTLFVGEDAGKVHAVAALGTSAQFVEKTGFPFTVNASAVNGAVIWDPVNAARLSALTGGRIFFGNAAGEVFELYLYPATWTLNTNYYRIATGGVAIRSMPLAQDGILYVSNSAGKLFVFDADNGAGLALMTTYSWFGNASVGDVSRDPISNRVYVATSAGRLYALATPTDPTPAVK